MRVYILNTCLMTKNSSTITISCRLFRGSDSYVSFYINPDSPPISHSPQKSSHRKLFATPLMCHIFKFPCLCPVSSAWNALPYSVCLKHIYSRRLPSSESHFCKALPGCPRESCVFFFGLPEYIYPPQLQMLSTHYS